MKKLFVLILLIIGLFLAKPHLELLLSTPIQIRPYPYDFSQNLVKHYKNETQEISNNTDILIIGDRQAKRFANFLPPLTDQLSKYLASPLRVYNWAVAGEGLNRTLFKLKLLKSLPSVIIYLGGTEEDHEVKFNYTQINLIQKNWNIFDNEKKASIIMSLPFLSKFFYHPIKRKLLEREIKKTKLPDDLSISLYKDISYRLFKSEFDELTNYVREKKGRLISIAPAHNLDIPPKKVCPMTTSPKIEKTNTQLKALIELGIYKESITGLQRLGNMTKANALTWFLLGQALKKTGEYKDAKSILYRAQAYDCSFWRGHMGLNKIIIQDSEKKYLDVIDFNAIVNNNFGKNVLFFDEIQPQNFYYDKLTKEVKEALINILQLRQ